MRPRPFRYYLVRSLVRGLLWWLLAACYLTYRELLVFHPDLFGI